MINSSPLQKTVRIVLGVFLMAAGIGHMSFSRVEFQAQVPPWIPISPDVVVILSGIVEITLGAALIFLVKQRIAIGWIAALFFILVFPGNIAQLTEHRNGFGLDTELKRWLRLPFQVVLIAVSLWSTGAWQSWRIKNKTLKQPSA